jgi:DNA-binding transcriptional MerR regulator
MNILELDKEIKISFVGERETLKLFENAEENIARREIVKYQSKEIQKKAQVTENQIKHWTNTGIIIPFQATKGTGRMHTYDNINLIEAVICRELSQYSINLWDLKEIISYLRETKFDFLIQRSTPFVHVDKSTKYKVKASVSNTVLSPLKLKHTLWEYLQFYPQQQAISIILWKHSLYIKSPFSAGSYNFYITASEVNENRLTSSNVDHIHARCLSNILINLSIIINEAGCFFMGDNTNE